jgi:glutamyl-tRNA synthetase
MSGTMPITHFAEIAELLFPQVTERPADVFARYPARVLPAGAVVTRFAPSPTGFLHIGAIYISLIGHMLTWQSDGIFILRIEDTDQQRKIEGGVDEIVGSVIAFGLEPDEGVLQVDPVTAAIIERGDYGPYQQSHRKHLYHVFAKELVAKGRAYASFQSEEELAAIRAEQEKVGAKFGYYGPWAKDRGLTLDEIRARLAAGRPFVIRYLADYPTDATIAIDDAIRGRIEMPASDQDFILLKSDGLPTYHFAHVVDEPTMRVNLVLRADEWLSTLPLHVQLFEATELPLPRYAHIAPIGKMDGSSKRKLSKRKDPEAAVNYYLEAGYPRQAILEYLLNVANSAFEEWRNDNPTAPFTEFPFRLEQMSSSVSLFDKDKLDSISRNLIATYSAQEVHDAIVAWAQAYNLELARLLTADVEYSVRVFSIDRGGDAPRKDLANWAEVNQTFGFFFDEIYARSIQNGFDMPDIAAVDTIRIADAIIASVADLPDKEAWLQQMREVSLALGFAPTRQLYKSDPGRFKGQFGDVMMVSRVALANQRFTPDLYEMMVIMGRARVVARMEAAKRWATLPQRTS